MVSFYKPKQKENRQKSTEFSCASLDISGRGVGHIEGRLCFVDGVLPSEKAKIVYTQEQGKSRVIEAKLIKLLSKAQSRQEPDCQVLSSCGGCRLQHIEQNMALNAKIEGIKRLFKKNCQQELPNPYYKVSGQQLSYRRVCRLAVRADRGVLSLGFRAEKSHSVTEFSSCCCLTDRLNKVIPVLREKLNALPSKGKIGHLDLIDSDGALGIGIRLVSKLTKEDEACLNALGKSLNAVISVYETEKVFLHPTDLKPVEKLVERLIVGEEKDLYVTSAGCRIYCRPSSFVQINKEINAQILKAVQDEVQPHQGLQVLDLFCGLGNFSLPLASKGAQVTGVDVVAEMIKAANKNALELQLPARFYAADLESSFETQKWSKNSFEVVVLDPGRQGARHAVEYLARKMAEKIVYVSCNPMAASRDSLVLLQAGYKIERWGVFDMFPRTSHIESLWIFKKK